MLWGYKDTLHPTPMPDLAEITGLIFAGASAVHVLGLHHDLAARLRGASHQATERAKQIIALQEEAWGITYSVPRICVGNLKFHKVAREAGDNRRTSLADLLDFSVNGIYHPSNETIILRPMSMRRHYSEITLIHELAHHYLHTSKEQQKREETYRETHGECDDILSLYAEGIPMFIEVETTRLTDTERAERWQRELLEDAGISRTGELHVIASKYSVGYLLVHRLHQESKKDIGTFLRDLEYESPQQVIDTIYA